MRVPPPLISVIVINFNGGAVLRRFLESVLASDHSALELLIVDNASTDGSLGSLPTDERIQVVRSGENVGFGRACNLGAARAAGAALLFCNPDVVLRAETLTVLSRDLFDHDDVAIVCPAADGPDRPAHERQRRLEDVAAMPASAMLVRAEDWHTLGGFDPSIFLYYEDLELCYRSWLLGMRVVKDWDAVVWHDVGGSGGGHAWATEQIGNGLYVYLTLRAWPAVVRFGGRMAAKTLVRSVQLRDPRVLGAWTRTLRRLPAILRRRRRLRNHAGPERCAQLERLAVEHARWQRLSRRADLRARTVAARRPRS